MKIKVWVQTSGSLSRVTDTVEISDEDLEGLTDDARSLVLDGYARDAVVNLYEWGYDEIP